jgi:polar amino acid transport system substrate-binding protein
MRTARRGLRFGAVAAAAALLGLAGAGAPGGGSARAPLRAAPVAAGAAGAPACDLTTSLTPSTSDSGPAVQKIVQRGKLIAGIDTNSYLWGFRDPATGALEGFDIDLVHAIAKAILGNPDAVEFRAVPTAQRVAALQSGTVDVVVRTMSITCERKQQVAFSTPYFTAGQQLVVPRSSPIAAYGPGLKGKRVCAATGSTAESLLKQQSYGAVEVPVANQLDCLVQMELGDVDATLTDNALGAGQAAQDPTVHLVGGLLSSEPYGVAMNLGATDLVRRVNAVLADYRSGEWQQSYDRWLAARLGPSSGPPQGSYAG